MTTKTWLECPGCKTTFGKQVAEIKRQQKTNPTRQFYCSISCYAQHKGKESLGAFLGVGQPQRLTPGSQTDEYSAFRYFMRKARNREHDQKTDLDLPYLKNLWEEQDGHCAISGVRMELPKHAVAWGDKGHDPWKPSLDRIDSSKGYLKGNVRFVTMIANLAKQDFLDEQLFEFCKAVVNYQATKQSSTPYQPTTPPHKTKETHRVWGLCA